MSEEQPVLTPNKDKKEKAVFKKPKSSKDVEVNETIEVKEEEKAMNEIINEEKVVEVIEEPVVKKTPEEDHHTKEASQKVKTNSAPDSSKDATQNVIMLLVKLAAGIFVWLPTFICLLVSLVGLGISISLTIADIQFLWLLLIVVGFILVWLAFVIPLTKLIWGKK